MEFLVLIQVLDSALRLAVPLLFLRRSNWLLHTAARCLGSLNSEFIMSSLMQREMNSLRGSSVRFVGSGITERNTK